MDQQNRMLGNGANTEGTGDIRHFGVLINDRGPETALDVVRAGRVDTVQRIYTIFIQSPAGTLVLYFVWKGTSV